MDELDKAAEWWATRLTRLPRLDNGDKSERGDYATTLAMMAAANEPPVTCEQLVTFSTTLKKILTDLVNGCQEFWIGLFVDYGPCDELASAAEAAGLTGLRFPWKTTMTISRGSVQVSEGYGAPYVELMEAGDGQAG